MTSPPQNGGPKGCYYEPSNVAFCQIILRPLVAVNFVISFIGVTHYDNLLSLDWNQLQSGYINDMWPVIAKRITAE